MNRVVRWVLGFDRHAHSGEFERIVFIGLSFNVGPSPRVFVRGTDEGFESEAYCQIVDSSRRSTSFHDNKIDLSLLLFEDGREVVSIGGRVEKRMFSRVEVKKAAHGIEYNEIESENSQVLCVLWVWGWKFATDCSSQS